MLTENVSTTHAAMPFRFIYMEENGKNPGGYPTTLSQPHRLPRLPAVGRRENGKRPLFLGPRGTHISQQSAVAESH